jgi:hypothetical protein
MEFEKLGPTVNEAMAFIHQLEAKFSAEGNIDSERDVLQSIRTRLMSAELTPQQAMREAQAVDDGRIER